MAKHPVAEIVGDYGLEVRSPLYVGGIPMEALANVENLTTDVTPGQRAELVNRFWATPARSGKNNRREVLEVKLATDRLINKVGLSIAQFPCKTWLQYFDEAQQRWINMKTPGGQHSVLFTVRRSQPPRIPADVVKAGQRHPQHFGAGHWQPYDVNIKPIIARRFRVIMVRIPSSNAPVDRKGNDVKYSLGMKDLELSFVATNPGEVPNRPLPTQNADETQAIAQTIDPLGSAVTYSFREHRAQDLITAAEEQMEGVTPDERQGGNYVWRCEPQPFSYAVVNLYADARDSAGQPQSVDRFFVDPTTPGVHCNLYYSNDEPNGSEFEASDQPLRYPTVKPFGSASLIGGLPNFPETEIGFVDITNAVIQWPWESDWWFGFVVQPAFDSTEEDLHTLLDTKYLNIRWVDGNLLVTAYGQTVGSQNIYFTPNTSVPIVVARVGRKIFVQCQGWTSEIEIDDIPESTFPDYLDGKIRLGGALADEPGVGGYKLRTMVLKKESVGDFEAFTALGLEYSQTSDLFVKKPQAGSDEPDRTMNALLRQHPDFSTGTIASSNPFGVVGGAGTVYENLEWTPVCRDYKMRRGYMEFNPVKARFFKFEFTSLQAQPYQSPKASTRQVRLFTNQTVQESTTSLATANSGLGGSGTVVNTRLGDQVQYSDMVRLVTRAQPDRGYEDYTPTEALYSTDPVVAERLAEKNSIYGFEPWRLVTSPPRFPKKQLHIYEVVEVAPQTKVAYFVGLKALRMFKVDYTAPKDAGSYLFYFHDADWLDDGGGDWVLNEGDGITSPSPLDSPAVTTSKVFNSQRNLKGVQFASLQTPPTQMLIDPDFNDRQLTQWQAYLGATVEPSDDIVSSIGSAVKITRQRSGASWDYIESAYPDYDGIEATGLTWDELEGGETILAVGGIESLQSVNPASGGRLYAAARVYAPKTLVQPLRVQIVSAVDNIVLSDEQLDIQGGRVAEWHNSYTIGEISDTESQTWDEVEAAYATWDDIEGVPYVEIDTTTARYTGPVRVRLVQSGVSQDVFYVDNLSLFQDAIVWEFSNDDGDNWYPVYDIRNNPYGVFIFPESDSETLESTHGTNLRWRVTGYAPNLEISALEVRPWYLTLPLGVPFKEISEDTGPNLAAIDQYAPVVADPMFKLWEDPIPQEWYFSFRQWVQGQEEFEEIDTSQPRLSWYDPFTGDDSPVLTGRDLLISQLWQVQGTGQFGVDDNQAEATEFEEGTPVFSWVDTLMSDANFSVTMPVNEDDSFDDVERGLIFRGTKDLSSFWVATSTGLFFWNAGVRDTIATWTETMLPVTVKVVAKGTTIGVFANNVAQIAITDTRNYLETVSGLWVYQPEGP